MNAIEQAKAEFERIAKLYEENHDAPTFMQAQLLYDVRCIARTAIEELSALPVASESDRKDAERWRETLRHIGGTHTDTGAQRFTLRYLSPIEGANIMRGSAAGHFTEAIDAALAAQSQQGESNG